MRAAAKAIRQQADTSTRQAYEAYEAMLALRDRLDVGAWGARDRGLLESDVRQAYRHYLEVRDRRRPVLG